MMTRRKGQATANNETQSNVAAASIKDNNKKKEKHNMASSSAATPKAAGSSETIPDQANTSLSMSENEDNVDSDVPMLIISDGDDTNLADKGYDNLAYLSPDAAQPAKKKKKKRKKSGRKSSEGASGTDASAESKKLDQSTQTSVNENLNMQELIKARIETIESGKAVPSSLQLVGPVKLSKPRSRKEECLKENVVDSEEKTQKKEANEPRVKVKYSPSAKGESPIIFERELKEISAEARAVHAIIGLSNLSNIRDSSKSVKEEKDNSSTLIVNKPGEKGKLTKSPKNMPQKEPEATDNANSKRVTEVEKPFHAQKAQNKTENATCKGSGILASVNHEAASSADKLKKIGNSPQKSVSCATEKESPVSREYELDNSVIHIFKDGDWSKDFSTPVSATKSEINEVKGPSKEKLKTSFSIEEKNSENPSTENQLNISDDEIKIQYCTRPVIFVKDKFTQTNPIPKLLNVSLKAYKRPAKNSDAVSTVSTIKDESPKNVSEQNVDSGTTVVAKTASSESHLPVKRSNIEMNRELPSILKLTCAKNNPVRNSDSDSTVSTVKDESPKLELQFPAEEPHFKLNQEEINNSAVSTDLDSMVAKGKAAVSDLQISSEDLNLENIAEDIKVRGLPVSDLSSIHPDLQNIRDDFLRDLKALNERFKRDYINCFNNKK